MPARVILAMSGGVDSSVAAVLLKQKGYEVIGLFMRTGVHDEQEEIPAHKKGCCSAMDAGDARRVADQLDIPFYALDFENDFGKIIDYFADEYLRGRTPNPCVVCNNWLKFGKLWSYGRQLQADYVATGHYAQVLSREGRHELHRGADPEKDQSYVLFGIDRELLPRLLFPVGGYQKSQIRRLARESGLGLCDKPDSVEICFVPGGDHVQVIRQRRPDADTAGEIVDTSGKVLARHSGIEKFTVGQRKGLGFAAGSRRFVLEIIPQENRVVVGDREDLLAKELLASRTNWLIEPPTKPVLCQAKIRYRHQAAEAVVFPETDDWVRVVFSEPQQAITPGQAVVFYEGTRVLGGGWIEQAERKTTV
ncbi:MAG: tRNA-specific 2-thiouridylase MnmA [Gemmatales bacterium]|nr:MAG: tRNA-specific 2-thiouridylase MnmA [Gemmatales bacterium]